VSRPVLEARRVRPEEVRVGLVVFMGLERLVRSVAARRYGPSPSGTLTSGRPLLCVDVSGDFGLWSEIYSNPGPRRVEIPRRFKRGHPRWRRRSTYIHLDTAWVIPHRVVTLASYAEASRFGSRNTVVEAEVPVLDFDRIRSIGEASYR
jgi:hypothetical protein